MRTSGFKKNFRGATTYAMPASDKYRDNYDRIFGKKDAPAEEPSTEVNADGITVWTCCQVQEDEGHATTCRFHKDEP